MARVRYNHNYFSIGFLSKHILGNTDFEGYNNALAECVNFIVQPTGGLFKRPGTYFVAEAHSDNPRLILFSYSSEDQYVCEFGNQYIRYFTKNGPLLDSNGSEVETKTDFSTEDVHSMTVQQDGNVLILVTPKGLFSLSRVSFNEFVLQTEEYTSEPLTFANYERISIKPSATTGDIELTVVNPDQEDKKPDSVFAPFFNESDVGHYVVLSYRLADTDNTFGIQMYYLKIKSVSQDTGGFNKAIAEIDKSKSYLRKDSLPSTDSVLRWHLGAFNVSRGMPIASACYEGRLFLANSKDFPNGIWGSSKVYFDWTDFFPGPNDADAVMFKMTAQKAGEILWLCAQSKLFVGTRWGIYIAGAASFNDEAITPSNFHVSLFEATGASPLAPVVGCGSVFFVDVSGKRVHEIHLSTETGAYQADDISLLSDDLTQSGIVAHEWQQNPIKIYWCAVQDGYLCSLTYKKNNGLMSWAKQEIMGNNVKVEQLCTMHGDKNDLIWMVVRREIDGEFKRYIEYLHSSYDPLQQEEFKQFYVDSGVTKELKHKISGIKRGNNPKLKIQISASIASQLKELISTNNGVLEIAFNPAEGTEDLTIPNFSGGGDICFGGRYPHSKKFVAVQNGIQGAYSTDGEIWNNFNLPDNSDWCSVCWGQREFMVVSKSGKSAHSFDNMDAWNGSDLPFSGNHMTVCYWPPFLPSAAGYFVAISDNSDKIAINRELFGDWRTVEIPHKYLWTDLCFGDEMLVLVAKNTNVVTFTEGDVNNIKFRRARLPVKADWCSVCYCNGKFIAVSGGNSNEAAYGVQKKGWNESQSGARFDWSAICYGQNGGDGTFVALATDGNWAALHFNVSSEEEQEVSIEASNDALNDSSFQSICYGDGKFVAVGAKTVMIGIIENGHLKWTVTEHKLELKGLVTSICYGDGKFVAIEYGTNRALYSTDGTNWYLLTLPIISGKWSSICYGAGIFVAVAKGSSKVAYSSDGIVWRSGDIGQAANWDLISYGDNRYLAIASDSGVAAYSTNGINWKKTSLPKTAKWSSVCYGNHRFFMISKTSKSTAYSFDGVNWNVNEDLQEDCFSVCYGAGMFTTMRYSDGVWLYTFSNFSWSSSKLPSKANWTSVHAIDDTTVIAISDSQTAYSTDGGISWKSGGNLPQNNWVGIANGNRRLIAINNTNKFAYSRNGMKWHSKKKADAGPPWNSRKRFFLLEPQIDNQYLIGTLFERVQNGSEKFSIKMKTTDFTNLSQQDRCEFYLSISDITGKQGQDIKCDTRMLSNGDEVILFDTNIEDFEKTGESYIIQDKTAVTVEMYNESGLGIEPNKGQIFRKISDLITVVDAPKECEILLEDEIENDAKRIYINKVNGMKQINNTSYKVFSISQDKKTITVFDERLSALCGQDAPLDAQHFSPFDTVNPTGNAYVYFDQMENLDHLEGQEVDICADGNRRQSRTVKDGIITFKHPVMYCSAGLCVSSHVKTTPFSGGSLLGSSVGAVGGQKSMWLHLYYSLGGRYGSEKTKTYPVPYTNFVSNFDKPKNLISGLIKCAMVNSKDVHDRSVYIEHNEPLAFNILSITQDINVSDS